MITDPLRPSSSMLYQRCWQQFYNFITDNNYSLTKSNITEFFTFLINRKFSYSTINVYKSALSSPIKLIMKFDISNDDNIKAILQYHKSQFAVSMDPFPLWKLDPVLCFYHL